jgi:hypothetical protein
LRILTLPEVTIAKYLADMIASPIERNPIQQRSAAEELGKLLNEENERDLGRVLVTSGSRAWPDAGTGIARPV